MELEDRYIVLKRKDIEDYLTTNERDDLIHVVHQIDKARRTVGKNILEALVIEHDWPEYEPTKKLLEERISTENWQQKIRKRDYMLEYARGMDEAGAYLQGNGEVCLVKGIGAFCEGWNDFVKKWLA